MFPPEQCFDADYRSFAGYLRLIVENEPASARDGLPKLVLDRPPKLDAVIHFRTEQAIGIPAAFLDSIERDVGLSHQLERIVVGPGRDRDSDARADIDLRSHDLERRLDHVQYALGELLDIA